MAENKPIMIDGVDVSGCKLYRDEISFVGEEIYTDVCSIWIWQRYYSGLEPSCVMKCHCEDNPNCLFKELARKTQECEELDNEAQNLFTEKTNLEVEIDQLKAENEELKNIINEAKNAGIDLKSFLLGEAIQKEYEEQIDKLKATNKQVEQKLERIREASKRDKDFCLKCNGDVEIDCIECIEGGRALLAKEILKIIDEVE